MTGRRGDIAVTLLVIMTVVLASVALFGFVKDYGKIDAYVINPDFMDNTMYQDGQIRFYFSESLEYGTVNAFSDVLTSGDFLKDSDSVNKEMVEKTKKYATLKINTYSFSDENLNEFKGLVNSGRFDVSATNAGIEGKFGYGGELLISDEYAYEGAKMVDLAYRPRFTIDYSFGDMSLDDFSSIKNALELCKDNEAKDKCLNDNLVNFESSIIDEAGVKRVLIESKSEFNIDGSMVKMQYKFDN